MGSDGLQWDVDDVGTAARMNRKSLFVGTGAQINGLSTTYAGQRVFCTSTGNGFIAGNYYHRNEGNTAWLGDQIHSDTTFPSSPTKGQLFNYTTPPILFQFKAAENWRGMDWKSLYDNFAGYTTQGNADAAWASTDTSKVRVNLTNDNLDFNFNAASTNIAGDFVLGSIISDYAWTLRFTLRFSALTQAANAFMVVCISDEDRTSDNANAQDALVVWIKNVSGAEAYGAVDADGGNLIPGAPDNSTALVWATSTDYFFELVKQSQTAYIVRRYSDSTYSTVSDSASGTSASTTTNLRYIKVQNHNIATNGVFTGTISNVLFLDGVAL